MVNASAIRFGSLGQRFREPSRATAPAVARDLSLAIGESVRMKTRAPLEIQNLSQSDRAVRAAQPGQDSPIAWVGDCTPLRVSGRFLRLTSRRLFNRTRTGIAAAGGR